MALRPTPLSNAAEAVKYYGAELGASEYYLKQKGVWHGKVAERLGLSPEVSREDFVAIVNNEKPGTHGDRLTARTNTTRKKLAWELDETSQSRVQVQREVSNRRVAVDWTFSLEKDKSVYLAKTKDPVFEGIVHKALVERLQAMEAETLTRVRRNGAHTDRVTGEALFAVFIHRTTRPVDGVPDPHWHAHCVMPNVTWDEAEGRFKAANLLFENKARHEEIFHARINELALEAGYGFRRTAGGLQMSIFDPKEVRIFCKRTKEIEALEQKQRIDLERKATAIVQAAAKRGEFLEYESEYKKLKDKLGERSRKGKDTAVIEGKALEAAWCAQLAPGRWDAITPEAARNGERIGFLEPELACQKALEHAFETRPTVREVDLFKAIGRFGAGSMSVAEMERFCQDDPRLVRNPQKPGKVTTRAIIEEETQIRALAISGKGRYEPLGQGRGWQARDKDLDAGQLAAVRLVLESRDLAVCIPGYAGTGKSRTVAEAARAVKELTGHDVMILAPTGRAAKALAKDAGVNVARTIAYAKMSEGWQANARGRAIFVDEFSLVGNSDAHWLLHFALQNNCPRVVLWGDGKQHAGVARGDPVADLLEAGILQYSQLTTIYRQQANPELLAVVKDAAEGRFVESFEKVKAADMLHVADNEHQLRSALVEEMVAKLKADEPVIATALLHRHGEAIARDVRARLKAEGLLAKEDRSVKWLREVELSAAQRSDAVNYRPGQIAKFYRLAPGGFRSGQAWTVERVEDERVIVSRDGREKPLPLQSSVVFQVYESGAMPLADGDRILITKNNPRAGVKNGDIVKVAAIDERSITLEGGKKLDVMEGLHARSGYSVTGPGSQGHQAVASFPFLPASAAGLVNQRSWLVAISRAQRELKVFTDCPELLEQRVVTPEDRDSALSLVAERKEPAVQKEVDLQAFVRRIQKARLPERLPELEHYAWRSREHQVEIEMQR